MPDLPLATMRAITKRYGSTTALQNVDFTVLPGEVHILAGENGAGKSTLIKILAGVAAADEGSVQTEGPVAVIYQELSLIPSMSIADNLLLGRHPARHGWLRNAQARQEAKRLLDLVHLDLDPQRTVDSLPIGQQQLIEVAKAIGRECRLVVMDEPTSALSVPEVNQLFALIADLKSRGCGIVYITHKMEEIYRIGDRITVLRDGRLVGSNPIGALPAPRLIEWMVGREICEQFPARQPVLGPERLTLQSFSVSNNVRDVSFTLRAGEIMGIAGLQGSGATELLSGLFGCVPTTGHALLDGVQLKPRSPRQAIARRVALVPNDRKTSGLVLSMSVTDNTTLAAARSPWRSPTREQDLAREATAALHLRAASLEMNASELSGGNQQKIVLAKWMLTQPSVLLLDEPTRGVDVGAKREIYQWIFECAAKGTAILLISTELPELLALSDRVLVLHRGEVMRILNRSEATPERVLAAAMGDAA